MWRIINEGVRALVDAATWAFRRALHGVFVGDAGE